MSISMNSKTKLVNPRIADIEINSSAALKSVTPSQLSATADLLKFSNTNEFVNYVYGWSRSDHFRYAVKKLCGLSEIKGLEFFYGELDIPCRWKFPIDDEPLGKTCEYLLGYWIDGKELQVAQEQISALLNWSTNNASSIEADDFLDPYPEVPIIQAITDGQSMSGPEMNVAYAEDGDCPSYLFAYLGTCSKLFANAIKSNSAVLHVREHYI